MLRSEEEGWGQGVVAVKGSLVPSIGTDAPRHADILLSIY